MTSIKPKVAVTGPNSGGLTAWLFTALNVHLAGGKPVRVRPCSFTTPENFDAIIIGGGSDIHPDNFEDASLPKTKRKLSLQIKESLLYPMEFFSRFGQQTYDKERDKMEQAFIKYALEKNVPLLGICRGHQLLNATLGGSMYTSTLPLLKNKPRIRTPLPQKDVVTTKPDTLIGDIAGDEPIEVNAIHSQAVAKPAESLKITGKETAGINQVLESKESSRVLGVQWHPEYLVYRKAHRNIFSWLVQEATQ